MRCFPFFLALTLSGSAAFAAPPNSLVRAYSVASEIVLSLDEGAYRVGTDEVGTLSIRCLAQCGATRPFEDKVGLNLMGITKPVDTLSLVFVNWASGSSYRTTVYHIAHRSIRKVFDQYSVGGTEIGGVISGNLVVRNTQYVSERSRKTIMRSWTWIPRSGSFVRH
jgi:hypothetical protein